MAIEYKISTVLDFLALTPRQRVACAIDLVAWAEFVASATAASPGLFKPPNHFIWCDDDRVGEVSGVVVIDASENVLHRADFPA